MSNKDKEKLNNITHELLKLINNNELMVLEFIKQLAEHCIKHGLGLDVKSNNGLLVTTIYINQGEYTVQSVEELTFELINNCELYEVIGKVIDIAIHRFNHSKDEILGKSIFITFR